MRGWRPETGDPPPAMQGRVRGVHMTTASTAAMLREAGGRAGGGKERGGRWLPPRSAPMGGFNAERVQGKCQTVKSLRCGAAPAMNPIRTLLTRMFGLVKHHVGTDQFGNKYYYVPQQKTWTGQTFRSRRIIEAVIPKEIDYEVGNIPIEWEGKNDVALRYGRLQYGQFSANATPRNAKVPCIFVLACGVVCYRRSLVYLCTWITFLCIFGDFWYVYLTFN
ncbi:NADH dehydrogenase [ubiquinone] 1 alpha subcomplex assembly factor 2 isoform X2 [Rhinoraja longicauda]